MITQGRHPTERGVYRLTTELRVAAPLDDVFAFFADAFNLEAITPPWLNFRVLTAPPIDMREETLIDYKLRLHGLPIRWRTRIEVWEPPLRFVDRQLRGPYRLWRHEHTFVAEGDETLVRDQVDYRVPGGSLIHRLFVARDVRTSLRIATRCCVANGPRVDRTGVDRSIRETTWWLHRLFIEACVDNADFTLFVSVGLAPTGRRLAATIRTLTGTALRRACPGRKQRFCGSQ